MTKDKFLERARSVHGYKYEYIDIPDKIRLKDYIKLKYDGVIYEQNVNKHLIGKCCEKSVQRKTTEQFIKESKLVWKDRFDYKDFEYKGARVKIKLYDRYFDRYINQLPSAHLRGHECKSITNNDFIKISEKISDYRYGYDLCEFNKMSNKVTLICENHGNFEVVPYNHINFGEVCSKCLFTNFKKKTIKFLEKRKIDYHQQYKFNDSLQIFDFYIYSMGIVIDFTYDDTDLIKQNDLIKNEYCEDNYIDLIRIRYDQVDDIERILYNNLKSHIKRLGLKQKNPL